MAALGALLPLASITDREGHVMSAGFNQAIVLGRLVANPERIATKSGSVMLKAIIEVSTYRRSADGKGEEQTTKVPCTLFGKQAETFEKYVEIGHFVQLVGRLDGYERKSQTTGEKWLTPSFVVEQLILLPNGRTTSFAALRNAAVSKSQSAAKPKTEPRNYDRAPVLKDVSLNEDGEPDDIPF
jgi:single-stranded DNA-binding protein